MKQPQRQLASVVDSNFILRDLNRLEPDLLRPTVLCGINELPEHRRVLYLARVEKLTRPDDKAKAA
jgi:hypothetical protein